MKLSDSKDFEVVPEGVYTARCIRHIDGGTQETDFQGNISYKRQLRLTWELLDDEVKMNDGRPFAISKTYTASLNDRANLRRDLEAWRGKKFTAEELKGFESKFLIGTYCTIQIIHRQSAKGNMYANVNSIMAAKKPFPAGVNEMLYWSYDEVDPAIFAKLTQWEQEYVGKAEEWYPDIATRAEKYATKLEPTDDAKKKDVEIEDIPDEQEKVDKAVSEAAEAVGGTPLTKADVDQIPF